MFLHPYVLVCTPRRKKANSKSAYQSCRFNNIKKHVQLSVFFLCPFQVFVSKRQLLLDGIVIIFYGSKHINSYLFFTDCVLLSRFVFHGNQIFESSKYFFVKS